MNKIKQTIALATFVACGVTTTAALATPPTPNATPAGDYTFSGLADLSVTIFGIPINASGCTLTLMGNVKNTTDPDAEGVYLDITGGTVTGPGQCGNIDLMGFTSGMTGTPGGPGPWEGFTSDADAQSQLNQNSLGPIDIDVEGITVSTPVGTCNGSLTASFFNGESGVSDSSFFTFDGSIGRCSVNTKSGGLVIQPSMSDNDDVNIQ